MSARNQTQRVASVEDADESGNIIEGTDRYAESVASPTREKPNTSRARREKLGRDSPSPISGVLTDSDSTIHPISPLRRGSRAKPSRETRERKEVPLSNSQKRSSNKQAVIAMRPAPKHAHTTNPDYGYARRSDEASYYGVPTTVTAASSRPRPQPSRQRPASYYGPPSRPPQANARFYAHPPPSAPLPTSYPPPSWAAGPVVYPGAPPAPAPQPDYFAPRQQNLMARFNRPQSAMGHRPTQTIAYDYEEEDPRPPLVKRASVSRKVKADLDRRTMPPPARPASARPTTLAFRPPPTTPARRSVAFDDTDLAGDADLFRDISPLTQYNYSPPAALQRTRRPSVGATSVSYDTGPYRTEVATSRPNRRHSYLGNQSVSSGSGYEDKMRQATAYQNDIDGGPTMPLTAESLRKASKNGGSSRSTRSSGSHDESEYRRSATTRTTRSSGNGGNDEDVTIRVKGQALLKVGGAEMQCQDGAEINITRGPGGYLGGSDKSSYVDIEDRRSRMERPQARIRSSSQAGSYPRSAPRYDMPLSRYDNNTYQYPPPSAIPPYPAYPSRYENEF